MTYSTQRSFSGSSTKGRKYVRKPLRKGKGPSPMLKRYIAKTVRKHDDQAAEKKQLITAATNQTITTAVNSVPTSIALMPSIGQGVGSYQRIGNSVKVIKSFMKLSVCALGYNAATNPENPILVKLWIVSNKIYPNQTNLASTGVASDFFKINNGTYGHLVWAHTIRKVDRFSRVRQERRAHGINLAVIPV